MFAAAIMIWELIKKLVNKLFKEQSKLEIEDKIKIEQYYGLSRNATLVRLIQEGYLNNEVADTMKNNVIKSAVRLGYDKKLYISSPENRKFYTLGK